MSSPSFNDRTRPAGDLHLARKAWHIGGGILLYWFAFASGLPKSSILIFLAFLTGFVWICDGARLFLPGLNRLTLRLFGPLMRRCETAALSGTPYFLLGTTIVYAFFPRSPAQLAILFLIVADPAASVVGILTRHAGPNLGRGKSLYGVVASAMSCFLVTVAFVLWSTTLPATFALKLGLVGAFCGLAVEMLPLPLNDNVTYPLLSACILWPALAFVV